MSTMSIRRSKVKEKNISYERPLNFDQWKSFSENYNPIRVWLGLVYKFTESYSHLWVFSELIQIRKTKSQKSAKMCFTW